jgi:hypothetical protein
MAAAGVPLRTLQELMGHQQPSTTAIYAHYAPTASAVGARWPRTERGRQRRHDRHYAASGPRPASGCVKGRRQHGPSAVEVAREDRAPLLGARRVA